MAPQQAAPRIKPPADGDYHRGYQLIVIQFVFVDIATALVIARIIVRVKIVRKVGWDDWLIIPALVSRSS